MHHPAIFADLEARKYPSARAAGIAAGIVRVPTPLETILRLLPRLDGRGTGVRGAKGAPSTHVT
jgi:hypothetical protein